jgi:hypothetical protein
MADRWAITNGNWSSTSTWNGGTLPAFDDDVFADNRTVTIDQDIVVLSLRTTQRTGGTAGGSFIVNDNVRVVASFILPGTTTCVTFNTPGGYCSIVSNVSGSSSTASTRGVINNSSGTISLIGDLFGSNFNAINFATTNQTVLNFSTGNIHISSNFVYGPAGRDFSYTILNSNTGIINITADNFIRLEAGGADDYLGGIVGNNSTGTINISARRITASPTVNYSPIVVNNSSGTISITANNLIVGPNYAARYFINNSSGTLNYLGHLLVPNTSFSSCILNRSTGTINVSGSIIGQGGNPSQGISTVGGICNFQGYVQAGTNTGARGITVTNTGGGACITNIVGTLKGSPVTVAERSALQVNGGTSVVNITGFAFGNSTSTNTSDTTIEHRGGVVNFFGSIGNRNSSDGIGVVYNNNLASGAATTLNLYGSAWGFSGFAILMQNSNSILNITDAPDFIGRAYGGTTNAVNNPTTGICYIKRVVGAFGGPLSPTLGTSPAVVNSQNGLVYVEQIEFGAQGATPVSGPIFILPAGLQENRFFMRTAAPDYQNVPFFNSFSIENLFPEPRDVRKGVVYAFGDFIGTMSVPSPSAVQFDVPVDNTKGELFLRPQNFWEIPRSQITNPTTIGYRLKNVATTGAVGQLIASFNLDALSGYDGPASLPLVPQYIYYRREDERENFKWRTAYIAVSSGTTKFSVLVNGLSDIDFYNYFDRTNFSNCYWTLTTTPALSANRRIIRPTETATISGINGRTYTLYMYATGTMVGGISANIGGISTSDLLLPGITTTPQ